MFYHGSRSCAQSFQSVRQAFLQAEGLPLGDVLSENDIHQAFDAEHVSFARDEGDIYTPAVTLWAFLSQVLHAGRLRSCAAAVSRVIVLYVTLGRKPPSPDTGAYCRARAKPPEAVLRRLVYETADQLESRVPADWLWLGRHVKAGDGTTLLVPDTPENQQAWPQPRTQKPGLGFPILRMVALFSLATAAVCGVAIGPYKGKGTGEPALLRELFDRFQAGDIFLGDCYFCSYFLLALFLAQHVDMMVRQHQRRTTDFRRLPKPWPAGPRDHCAPWKRPMPRTHESRSSRVSCCAGLFRQSISGPATGASLSSQPLPHVTLKADGSAIRGCHLFPARRKSWGICWTLLNGPARAELRQLRAATAVAPTGVLLC